MHMKIDTLQQLKIRQWDNKKKKITVLLGSHMEKAASGACGHFVRNHAILRTLWAKYPVVFIEDGKRRVKGGELRFDKINLRKEDGELRI